LYLLRAMYAIICVGLGSMIWPLMFNHRPWTVMHGVACSLLAALSAMAAIGVRYPLQMLPLLLFELLWKTIWLVALALPLWRAGHIDPETMETVRACLMGVILCPLVIPWPYVYANYVKKSGDRWGGRVQETSQGFAA
jgi:hypothetical protein